jgi:hypothetical protein
MAPRTPPWENIKPMSLPRLPSRLRADSPTTPAAAPAAKAEHWDFTRADYAAQAKDAASMIARHTYSRASTCWRC